jgi:hypothetical protein
LWTNAGAKDGFEGARERAAIEKADKVDDIAAFFAAAAIEQPFYDVDREPVGSTAHRAAPGEFVLSDFFELNSPF